MPSRSIILHIAPACLWILAAVAVPIWAAHLSYSPFWDFDVYRNAVRALRAGHDPYVDGMAIQRAFHLQQALHANAVPPYTYVYSPVTLPLLRWIGEVTSRVSEPVYWTVYFGGALFTLRFAFGFAEPRERTAVSFLAPLVPFFPGLIQDDNLLSGNIAYVLYAVIFAGAWWGFHRRQWRWFYCAVVLASCCKVPLLTLLAIPVLSQRRQWFSASMAGVAGIAVFGMQIMVWPAAFRHYIQAVDLQFQYNHSFGSSIAGLAANALFRVVPYAVTSAVVYTLYALPVSWVLLALSRRYLAGAFSLSRWAPVMLTGVLLLNPRIQEYDVAAMTLLMGLILWRACLGHGSIKQGVLVIVPLVVAINLLGHTVSSWNPVAGLLLPVVFGLGAWQLFRIRPLESTTVLSGSTPPQTFETSGGTC